MVNKSIDNFYLETFVCSHAKLNDLPRRFNIDNFHLKRIVSVNIREFFLERIQIQLLVMTMYKYKHTRQYFTHLHGFSDARQLGGHFLKVSKCLGSHSSSLVTKINKAF